MMYDRLQTDFDNIRATQPYVVGKVIDEAQDYIEFLEDKQQRLDSVVAYLTELDASPANETKQEILDKLAQLLPA